MRIYRVAVFSTIFVAAAAVAVAADTAASTNKASLPKNDIAEPDVLLAKAQALAKSDMARMAAAEMVYRNKVFIHSLDLPNATIGSTNLYMKLYRRFTGYQVVDIEKTNSVLRPIKFVIRYTVERVGTRELRGRVGDSTPLEQAEHDGAFLVRDRDTVLREYFCNGQGEVLEMPSPILERPNFWIKNGVRPFGNTWVDDPYSLLQPPKTAPSDPF
jgi:hypothetical protein